MQQFNCLLHHENFVKLTFDRNLIVMPDSDL